MNEELKNLTSKEEKLLDDKKELGNLAIKVMKLQQALDDAENELIRMEKYFKHAYMMLVLEAMIGMSIIGFMGIYLLTTTK